MKYDASVIFQNLAAYNQRANRELFAILADLDDEDRKKNVGSYFGSIHGLLNHVIICDINWLKRFRALSPDSPALTDPGMDPPGLSWDRNLHEDFAELRENRIFVDEKICAWFAEFPSERLVESFHYMDSKGTQRPATAGSAFEFLFLHQIHHRGQISQVLDEMRVPNNLADNAPYLEGGSDQPFSII